ncbi:MAG: hypothetical protein Q7J57_01005 [Gemmobacter sp.]|nr:hypothetical protein [Gemmobacter sp.]
MIRFTAVLRGTAGVLACAALSACLGNGAGGGAGGGGGGGGTGLTPEEYDANFERVTGMIPTSDMPSTGSAKFTGTVSTELRETGPSGAVAGRMLGDLDMDINFDPTVVSPISGTATNFRGVIDGNDVAFSGTLATDAARLPTAIAVTEDTIPLPTGGSVDLRAGSMSANLFGDLELDGADGEVILSLGGAFVGPGAQASYGPAIGTWWGPTGPDGYVASGTYYIER